MANYKDKKKLIEDNSDIFISDYDKNLDYSYLSDIIDQKRAYTAAEKAGDTAGMQKANDRANSIRIQAGSYTAGADGSKYNRVKRPYETEGYSQPDNYYTKERKRVYKKIEDYPSFSYNPDTDPLYNTYKDIYLALGDDAYKRALGENSLRSEGIANTSAMSAAAMARNKYNSMLTSKIPELYEKAYKKYSDGKEDIYNQLEAILKAGDKDYEKYRDDVKDYKDNRQYYYDKDKDINDGFASLYKDENEREYKESRDIVKDNNDNRDYELELRKHNDNIALDTRKHEDNINFDKQKHDDNINLGKEKEINDNKTDKYEIAVKIAKVLYGDLPISMDKLNEILSIIQ